MTMDFSPLAIGIGLLGGFVLSALYFGGLWFSVLWIRKLKRKRLFLFLSWSARSILLCAGLYALALYNPASLLCGAVGLLVGRGLIVGFVKRKKDNDKVKETSAC